MVKKSCTQSKRMVGLKSARIHKQNRSRLHRRTCRQTIKTNPEAAQDIAATFEKQTAAWDIS